MILKIVFIAIICIFISSLLKKYNNEFASIVSICGGVLIFLLLIDEIGLILNSFKEVYDFAGINYEFLEVIFKVLGISYIIEFTADIAEDFGNSAVANKVILGGKIVICGMTLNIVKNLLELLFSVLV
jgi:stage III sporulation protein AD